MNSNLCSSIYKSAMTFTTYKSQPIFIDSLRWQFEIVSSISSCYTVLILAKVFVIFTVSGYHTYITYNFLQMCIRAVIP